MIHALSPEIDLGLNLVYATSKTNSWHSLEEGVAEIGGIFGQIRIAIA